MTGKEPKCTGGEKMFRRFVKKLHSRTGESIGETHISMHNNGLDFISLTIRFMYFMLLIVLVFCFQYVGWLMGGEPAPSR